MADPLSIVASVIAVAGAADAVLSFISQLQNAPDEIMFLHNDVTDTQLILSNIKDNANGDQTLDLRLALPDAGGVYGNPETIFKAEYLIRRIERVLQDIESTLRNVTKSRALGRATVHQRAWILHRSKLRSLRQELRELKTSVAVHFSSSSSTHAQRSVVLLKRVLLENAQTVQQQKERGNEFQATLQELAQQLAELSVMPEAQRQLVTLVENLSTAVVTSEESSRQKTTTTTESAQVFMNQDATGSHGESQGAAQPSNSVVRTSSTTISTESVSRLKLEFSRFQKRGCVPECECTCHQRRRYRSPSFAQKVLGQLFVGFSTLPLLSARCSDDLCTQRSPFSATLTYYLPTFFLKKMVSLILITTSQGDPAACVKVRPLSSDFSIYRAAAHNDLQAVRKLVDGRLAHPSAGFMGGWTPLHYAISNGHAEICRSLLAVGADPLIEDGTNMLSPLEWAWIKILGRAFDGERQQELEQLFSDRECLEEMRFTTLHRIILGLDRSSLQSYISRNTLSINGTDSYGRTALSWAAQRDMVEAVQTLLDSGAEPGLCTPHGHSPLMYAAEARNPGCLRPLLEHGANAAQCDIEGQTAIHYAAAHRADLAYYRPLIEAGSDPNRPTVWRLTPLTTVISEGHNEAMMYLVDNGADINLKGHDERSPAFYAVEYNNHSALRFLYERSAVFMAASIAHPSIAHVAAHHADMETLRILTDFRLTLRDVDCVDNEGLAIPQIVDKRLQTGWNEEGDFAQAFNIFLGSVKVEGSATTPPDLEDDDEFHDAVEQPFA